MSEELIFLIGVILMNILFWTFIHIFEIKQTKLENKMELEKQVEQLENIRKEAIKLLKKCGIVDEKGNFNAYLDTIELKDLLNILNKGDNNGRK